MKNKEIIKTGQERQHHQMHSNWLKIEWVKNFSFFCDPQ